MLQNAPEPGKALLPATPSDSLLVGSELSKQQELGERSQNASEITRIYSGNSSTQQTNKPGSTNAQVTVECSASSSHDVDTSGTSRTEVTGQSLSSELEATCDLSPTEVKWTDSGSKKHKVRYVMNTSLLRLLL